MPNKGFTKPQKQYLEGFASGLRIARGAQRPLLAALPIASSGRFVGTPDASVRVSAAGELSMCHLGFAGGVIAARQLRRVVALAEAQGRAGELSEVGGAL